MTDSASSTYDEVAQLQPAREAKIAPRIAVALRRYGEVVPRTLSARDRYLGASIDHADFEKRSAAWDAHEEAALRRLAAGLY
jgi:hypothetical protein